MTSEELSRLFEQYGNDVYRFAYSITHHSADAEDICQTIFCRLSRGDISLEPEREKAWLLQCVANACKDRFRFLHRWKLAPLEEAVEIPDETERAVFEAVMALPAKYRAPVHLYYYEGYSQKEIAKILSISQTAVQTRMQRARDMLRKELCNYEITL